MSFAAQALNVLQPHDVAFFHEYGYLRLPFMFTNREIDVMAAELDWQIETWAGKVLAGAARGGASI